MLQCCKYNVYILKTVAEHIVVHTVQLRREDDHTFPADPSLTGTLWPNARLAGEWQTDSQETSRFHQARQLLFLEKQRLFCALGRKQEEELSLSRLDLSCNHNHERF